MLHVIYRFLLNHGYPHGIVCRLTTTVKQMSTVPTNIPDPCRRSARSKQFQTNYLALLTDLEALCFSLTLHNQNWHPQSFQQSINLLPACPPPQLTEEPSLLSPSGPEQYISRSCLVQIIKYFCPMQGAVSHYMYVCMDFTLDHSHTPIYPSPN